MSETWPKPIAGSLALVSLTGSVFSVCQNPSVPCAVPAAPEPQAAFGEAGPITSLLRRHEPKPMNRKNACASWDPAAQLSGTFCFFGGNFRCRDAEDHVRRHLPFALFKSTQTTHEFAGKLDKRHHTARSLRVLFSDQGCCEPRILSPK